LVVGFTLDGLVSPQTPFIGYILLEEQLAEEPPFKPLQVQSNVEVPALTADAEPDEHKLALG